MAAGNARNSKLLNYRVVLLYDLTEFNPIYNGTAGSNPSDSEAENAFGEIEIYFFLYRLKKIIE